MDTVKISDLFYCICIRRSIPCILKYWSPEILAHGFVVCSSSKLATMTDANSIKQQVGGSSMESILGELKQSMDSMHTKFDNFSQQLKEVQDKVRNLEDGQVDLAGKVSVLETTSATKMELSASQAELKEELERIRRASNVMMFGVEETEDGMRLADAVLRLILPHRTDHFVMHRQITKSTAKPRPLKVLLNNPGERNMALSNRKLMKGIPEYKSISVQPDRTKIQRTENAEKYKQKLKDLENDRVLRSHGKRGADQMEGKEVLITEPHSKVARKDGPDQPGASFQEENMEEVD